MRRAIIFLPLVLFLGFVSLALFNMGRPQQQQIASRMVGKPVPQFALEGLDILHPGLVTQDMQQGTPLLINVFASWCLPCAVEAPQLAQLAKEGVVVHGIAVRDKPQAVQAFLGKYGNPFRRIGLDKDGQVQIALGSAGVPESFIVDGQGIIRYQHIGVITQEDLPRLRAALKAARP